MSFWQKKLFLLSVSSLILFVLTSFLIYLESFKELDLKSLLKLQELTPKGLDKFLSYFSYLGNASVTFTITFIFMLISLFKHQIRSALAWTLILPATLIEVIWKVFLYHPPPSIEFLRTIKTTQIPTIYLHTEFSFPSGHATRSVFLATTLIFLILFSKLKPTIKKTLLTLVVIFSAIMLYSRISLGEHWFSDVLGGLFLGLFFASLSAKLILKERKS